MVQGAAASVGAFDAESGPWVKFIADGLYTSDRQKPLDRERCLLMYGATASDTLILAIHSYWALMLGLSVGELLQIVLLAGNYQGVNVYTEGSQTVQKVLTALAGTADTDPSMGAALGAIKASCGLA
jgi:hypothetical protein